MGGPGNLSDSRARESINGRQESHMYSGTVLNAEGTAWAKALRQDSVSVPHRGISVGAVRGQSVGSP